MNEDKARRRRDNGPSNHAILRRMALNVMRQDKTKDTLRGKFLRAPRNDSHHFHLLRQF
jgi:hypothetical protein